MDRSKKISELPVANSVGPNDLFLLIQANSSMAISANSLGIPASLTLTDGPIEFSNTIVANGTNDVLWFQYNGYTAVEIKINAFDVTTNDRSFGTIKVTANSSVANVLTSITTIGGNPINVGSNSAVSSNTVSLYFKRASSATSNVLFHYQVISWI